MMTATLVTGLVKVGVEADTALERIMALGYAQGDVSVIMSDQTRKRHFAIDLGSQTAVVSGAGLGMAVGSAIGAVIAAILLVGTSLVLPGIGLVVAGPLAAALMGVGAGGATGGAIGTLVGAGFPEHRARIYETALATGLIAIGVHTRSLRYTAGLEQIFRELGALEVQVVTSAPVSRSDAA